MPKILRVLGFALVLILGSARADLELAREGTTAFTILVDPGATEAEKNAAKELASTLGQITAATFPIRSPEEAIPGQAILLGPGSAARDLFPEIPWDRLGEEEIVLRTKAKRLLIAGGRPRGTLYAVSRFLQDYCQVRWWTPWASRIPSVSVLTVPELSVRARPAFEARDPFWYPAFDRDWAVRNFSNSQSAHLPTEWGGAVRYKGFVHTFFPLVPPEQYFADHADWFSLIKGKRTHERAQLCLTHPEVLKVVTERVRQWLRESPEARIVSISQNDWHGACECPSCHALDEAEESHAGTMLTFVNQIADQLGPEFPEVAFDTLAYQYTRKPPKTARPRSNVIVRLCSIECNFREPLDDPTNESFADDIRGWAAICDRLYVWDYTTDFAHYVQPHPNWYVLGPNLRFFHQHHVRGMFEQGAYQSHGSEMAELRAWVLAQLLWDPYQNDRALIGEFIRGYYGDAAAPFIHKYLDLMHAASSGFRLSCFSGTETPFHNFRTLSAAERLWEQAEAATANQEELRLRVRMARLPLRYVWLTRWESLRAECAASGSEWPLPASRRVVADEFGALANGVEGAPWTRITHLNERGVTVDRFLRRFADDPP